MNYSEKELLHFRGELGQQLIDRCKKDNKDALIIIFGDVGVGKSALACTYSHIISELGGVPFGLEKNVTYDAVHYFEGLTKSVPAEPFVLDEGTLFAHKRNALTRENKTINIIFDTSRSRRVINFLCAPEALFKLDKEIINRALAFVRVPQRGSAHWYLGKNLKHGFHQRNNCIIMNDKKKEVYYGKPSFKEFFREPSKTIGGNFWKDYEKQKLDRLAEQLGKVKLLKKDKLKEEGHDPWLTAGQVRDLYGASTQTLVRLANSGKITYIFIGARRKYKKSSVTRYFSKDLRVASELGELQLNIIKRA